MDYHTFHEIKRLYEDEKFSAYKIAVELGIDHKTVQRWIERPRFEKRSGGREEAVLKDYKKQIQIYLDRHNYSAVQLYDKIQDAGYTGSLSTVRNYVRKVRPVKKKAFLNGQNYCNSLV